MSMMKFAYNIYTGPVEMYAVDAQNAVARHPLEWSLTPWTAEETATAKDALKKKHEQDVADAKAMGLTPPPAPQEALPLTPEQQAEIDEYNNRLIEAKKRVEEDAKTKADEKAKADQIASDKALIAQPGPKPDPLARRPFGRKGPLSPAEQATADKKKAAEDKLAADKAEVDRLGPSAPAKPI